MNLLQEIHAAIDGKKTYIIGAIMFLRGGLAALGIHWPEWVDSMLVGAGLVSIRSAMKKAE